MNSRERMHVAMRRGRPDRPPLMCQLALGHYFLNTGIDPIEIWHDSDAFAQALVLLQRRYRFDGLLVNLPGRDPAWRSLVARITDEPGAPGTRRIVWQNGMSTVVPPDDNPRVFGRDGGTLKPAFEDVDPEKLVYMEPHDLSGINYPYAWGLTDEPAPLDPSRFFPPWQTATLRRARELAGPEVSIHAEIFSPFSQLLEMVDLSQGLMALLTDPGKVRAILDRLAEGATVLGRRYAAAGCDALLISSAFAGARLISRAQYAAFELPALRRVVSGIKAEHPDLPVYVHTCGAIGDRLDLLEATGVDGIDTFDPPPLGTIDLAAAVEALGGRRFIKGNIDPVNTLLRGSMSEVRAAVRERLDIAGGRGGYILSSACSVPPGAPPENLRVLAEARDEWSSHA